MSRIPVSKRNDIRRIERDIQRSTSTILSNSGGGSSSSSVIGDVKPLYITDVGGLYVNGTEEWLRTGVVDDDTASYPDAKVGNAPLGYDFVGLQQQDFDASTGLPMYVRIK